MRTCLSCLVNRGYLFMLLGGMFLACEAPTESLDYVLHPDFEMELVASEPLIFDPVDLEFDDMGDAYVLQMPGYPKGMDQSSIVKLVDDNQDGIFDRKIIYAENLAQASSLMPYRKGFLVAAPPNLLYLRDHDGDGIAEERVTLMSGFNDGNLQHNFNGLTYGLDHWIYVANGGNGGGAHWVKNPDTTLKFTGFDFRIRPEEMAFELTGRSSGGFELTSDKWGNIYGTHNVYHINSLVFPHRYIEGLTLSPRNTLLNISDHEENGLARVYPIGEQETRVNHPEQSGYFSGACGITHYGGGSFASEYDGNVFVNDVVLNLVHRDIIREKGPVLSASRAREGVDFLAFSDRSFRPVNSVIGPDGALYVVDMYRKVIEHPEWIPDEMEAKMDLDAGKDKGRIYRITQKQKDLFTYLNPGDEMSGWVRLLEHPNQWQRLTAQRIIVEEKWSGVENELLQLLTTTTKPETKLHILYTLRAINYSIEDLLVQSLQDADDHVKEHAIILAEPYLLSNTTLREKTLETSASQNPRIQMQCALSIGKIASTHSAEVLSAIESILQTQMDDPYIRMACVSAAKDHVVPMAEIIFQQKDLMDQIGMQPLLEMLAIRLAQKGNSNEQIKLLDLCERSPYSNLSLLTTIINGYSTAGLQIKSSEKHQWTTYLGKLESNESLSLISASWKLRKALGLAASSRNQEILATALRTVEQDSTAEDIKTESIKILSYAPSQQVTELLLSVCDARKPIKLQQAALDVLQSFNDAAIIEKLVGKWTTLSPSIRKRVTDLLIYNPANHDLMFSSLESGKLNLSEFNFDLERRRRVLNSKDESIRSRAAALFTDAGVVQRKDAIEKMRPAIDLPGNPEAGSKIYETQCATCHRFGSSGYLVGPDLTEISRKSRETLLHDILDPNAAADPEYINHIVEMSDGQVFSGIIENETDEALFIRMMGGMEKNIPKNQIKSLNSTGLSLMPEGLEGAMTISQLADLLAFLQEPIL